MQNLKGTVKTRATGWVWIWMPAQSVDHEPAASSRGTPGNTFLPGACDGVYANNLSMNPERKIESIDQIHKSETKRKP
jgi:hypothetical protein|tara:strand:+ start:1658 stop:1891 length:234 start_codon:yes stop_codon:yes gene_type:complete